MEKEGTRESFVGFRLGGPSANVFTLGRHVAHQRKIPYPNKDSDQLP